MPFEQPATGDDPAAVPAEAAVPAPAAEATPSPALTGADEARQRGLQQLEGELRAVAGQLDRLDQRLTFYEAECVGARYGNRVVINCADIEKSMVQLADQISASLDAALDRGRQSWLDPRTMQDARERAGLGAGSVDGLLARARRPGR